MFRVARALQVQSKVVPTMKAAATEFAFGLPGGDNILGEFDPAGFLENKPKLEVYRLREAELAHGRVGMLASAGFLVQEKFHPLFSGDGGPAVDQIPRLPVVVWFAMTLGIGACEALRIQVGWSNPNSPDHVFQKLLPDYVPGDMIASLTAQGMDGLDTVRLAYATDFQMTRGTMLSALEMIKGGDLEWRNGRLVPADPSVDRWRFDFGSPLGEVQMTRYPAGEHLTVPRHIETERVETMLSAGSIAPGALEKVTPYVARPLGVLMRTPVRKLTGRLVGRLPEGPTPESRALASFTVCCEAIADGKVHRGRISGRDVYGITAAFIVKGAIAAALGDIERSGGLAPSEAFDPALFLDGFEDFSLEWSVDTGTF